MHIFRITLGIAMIVASTAAMGFAILTFMEAIGFACGPASSRSCPTVMDGLGNAAYMFPFAGSFVMSIAFFYAGCRSISGPEPKPAWVDDVKNEKGMTE